MERRYITKKKRGLSKFGVVVSMFVGLVAQIILYTILKIDTQYVPVMVMVITWVVISAVIGVVLEECARFK